MPILPSTGVLQPKPIWSTNGDDHSSITKTDDNKITKSFIISKQLHVHSIDVRFGVLHADWIRRVGTECWGLPVATDW